jgi:hypothetical protein
MGIFSEKFRALLDEAAFTNNMLGTGVTQLGKANYANKGIYFQAFTSLSTGLERIGKLCLIVDYYITNKGQFPDVKYIKHEIGHDLLKLYDLSKVIIKRHNLVLKLSEKPLDETHLKILKILSDFARGDRYSNINLITDTNNNDPIAVWKEEVDNVLFNRKVSNKKKDKILFNAKLAETLLGPFSMVRHTSESREELNTVESASYQTGVTDAVSSYRQMFMLYIIRYWVEILRELQYLAMKLGGEDIPFFSEILAMFYNKDSYLKTRKTFDKIH